MPNQESYRKGIIFMKQAEKMKFTAEELYNFKVIDEIIKEPLGGGTLENVGNVASALKCRISILTEELKQNDIMELLDKCYEKFRNMGEYKNDNFKKI